MRASSSFSKVTSASSRFQNESSSSITPISDVMLSRPIFFHILNILNYIHVLYSNMCWITHYTMYREQLVEDTHILRDAFQTCFFVIYFQLHIFIWLHVCMFIYLHACVFKYWLVCTCTWSCTHMYVCIYEHISVHICMQTRADYPLRTCPSWYFLDVFFSSSFTKTHTHVYL